LPEPDQNHPTNEIENQPAPPAGVADPVTNAGESAETPAAGPALGDTTGMGTVLALGCIGGTVFLIVLGLIYLLITQLFG
jgi:hypothetical protein